MQKQKIAIAAGGTGGHLFPALSLGEQLEKRGYSVLFLGGGLSKNKLFQAGPFPYKEVCCARPSLKFPTFPFQILRGGVQSFSRLKAFSPSLLIGFGSYYTFPVLLAARFSGIPYILHTADSIPGRVNRFFEMKAEWTAIHFPEARKRLRGRAVEVAMPLRSCFESPPSREEAMRYYALAPNLPVLLVFGGSQGAERINHLLWKCAPSLRGWQVIHFTGRSEWTQRLIERYRLQQVNACVKDFELKMSYAWQAADLAISRAGAASIAEQIACAVPGVLIPYPSAMDQHQDHNAKFMVERVGGAVKCNEQELTPAFLTKTINQIIPQLEQMRQSIRAYRHHNKVPLFVDMIEKTLLARESVRK